MDSQEEDRRYADMERMNDDKKSVVDVHRCHICGFSADDVGSLSVHLTSVHPTTVQPHLSRRCTSTEEHGNRQELEVVDEGKPLSACLSGETSPRTNREPDAAGEVRPIWMSVFFYFLFF